MKSKKNNSNSSINLSSLKSSKKYSSKKKSRSKRKSSSRRSPMKNNVSLSLVKGSIFSPQSINKTSFEGSGEDILFAFQYLANKYKNFYMPLGEFNDNLVMWNVVTSWKCSFDKKFELHLPMDKNIFISKIQEVFKENRLEYILLPIYLGSSNCKVENGHFNVAIIDVKKRTYERFEPYGYTVNLTVHKSFNKKIVGVFKEAKIDLSILEINEYLPKISLQEIEEKEVENSISSMRNGDPGGFCGVWGTWYIELVFRNKHLSRKKLVKKAIKYIKGKKHFRNFIRNYSGHLVRMRKELLKEISTDCGMSIGINDYEGCVKKYVLEKLKNKTSLNYM